jgi:hypothetical protein
VTNDYADRNSSASDVQSGSICTEPLSALALQNKRQMYALLFRASFEHPSRSSACAWRPRSVT